MRWITRERPKLNRIACSWLIAPAAEFIYVAADPPHPGGRYRSFLPCTAGRRPISAGFPHNHTNDHEMLAIGRPAKPCNEKIINQL